jgi:hypothetical protein
MLLSELFGDEPLRLSKEERSFLEMAQGVWAKNFNNIVRESQTPKNKKAPK